MAPNGKESESELSCKECNISFESKEKLNLHLQNHSGVYCESCPIDVAIRKLTKLFRRQR